jgi:hypothetical protein
MWRDSHDTDEDVQRRIAAATAAGRIGARTQVHIVRWKEDHDEAAVDIAARRIAALTKPKNDEVAE